MNGKGHIPRQQTPDERDRFEREYDRIFRKKKADAKVAKKASKKAAKRST